MPAPASPPTAPAPRSLPDALPIYLEVRAAKTGMLHRAPVIDAVVARLRARPLPHLVVDPVMVATSGHPLLEPEGIAALRARLLPLATLRSEERRGGEESRSRVRPK